MPTGASQTFLTALPAFPREIKLRNYDPEDEELKKRKLPPAKPASGGSSGNVGMWEGKGGLGKLRALPEVGDPLG